jgi:hypothetical protein
MFSNMNPTLRGFLIIAAIALVIILLNLYVALASLFLIAQIAFFLAIAFFVYLLWRDRRDDIGVWPGRAKVAFYGGALLIVVAIGLFILERPSGFAAMAFLFTLVLAGFAMWRTWRDQHTYS